MLNESQKTQVRELCRDLIKIPSNSGQEKEIAGYLQTYLLSRGFDEARIDDYGNLVARVRGNRPGKCVLFDGHLDTVPVTDAAGWKHDPYGAQIEDGRIYGRGATDMKGADAAFAFAAGEFLRCHGRDFSGELCVAGVVHEERFEGVAARAVSAMLHPDVVIIGEASEMNIKCSQRGRAELVLETFGVPCHSSNPEKGVNAVYAICRLIEAFRQLPPAVDERMAGDGIMELTDIRSEPYPGASVVPEYCRATYDRRLLVGETRQSVLAPLQQIIDRMQAQQPGLRARISFSQGQERCYTGQTIAADRFFPGWLVDKKEDWIQDILHRVQSMGYTPQLTGYSFCTNGSHYAGEAGIPCIGMGPSRENLAHTIDEFVALEELYAITDYYTAAMEVLLK
ncbi:MAG: YgeY family selenium metabolism-linked hydrolase [Candidatus Faecousia sp.]|nr:YgeY family selenium metabolism-linked hydrolase [Candidatus Faecousia sp.]